MANLIVKIMGDARPFKRVARGMVKTAKSAGRAMGVGLASGAAGAVALVKSAQNVIEAHQVQAQAEAKLAAVLKATGYAAGFTTEQLKDQAAELQKNTGIGDELILSMQGILASFKNIKGDAFTATTKAILDMSTVMQRAGSDSSDIEQSAIQVGKALNDPIKGISALTRVGVTFTEQQKEQIKTMQESGDLMGAQQIILDELNGEFGGAAEGINSNVKAYRVLAASMGDAKERMGEALVENLVLTDAFGNLSDEIDTVTESGAIELWAERVGAAIQSIIGWMKPLISGWEKVAIAMKKAGAFVGALSGGASLQDARDIANSAPEWMDADAEERMAEIRNEREERKKLREEVEAAAMAAAQAKDKEGAGSDRKQSAAQERSQKATNDIVREMEDAIRRQEMLNLGLDRQAAIEDAILKAKRANAEISQEEVDRISSLAGRRFDLSQGLPGDELAQQVIDAQRMVEQQNLINAGLGRQAAIEDAIYRAKLKNSALSEAESNRVRVLAGQLYDLRRSLEEKVNLGIETPEITELERIGAIFQDYASPETVEELGLPDLSTAKGLLAELDRVSDQAQTKADQEAAYAAATASPSELGAAIAGVSSGGGSPEAGLLREGLKQGTTQNQLLSEIRDKLDFDLGAV